MKEATGQLSSGVIVVIGVAILVAFFYTVIYPEIKGNFVSETGCEKAVCEAKDTDNDGMVRCVYTDKGKKYTINCKYKG